MSVAAHLQIDLAEYDSRIRTFIPGYDDMLTAAAECLRGRERVIVELGIGTGALAERCARATGAQVVGIDEDAEMLQAARRRLGDDARLVHGSFFTTALPRCDAIVASLALHHVRTRGAKRRLYERLRRAVRRGGLIITADCHPSSDRAMAARHQRRWREHLRTSYSAAETSRYFATWAKEDVYMPLAVELRLFEDAGCRPEVAWRRGPFAVIAARA